MTAGTQHGATFDQLKAAHGHMTAAWVGAHKEAERRFWARSVVDGHLRRQAKELRDAYIQAAESPFDKPEQQEWLSREADELEILGETFRGKWEVGKLTGGITAVFGFPGIGAALGATGATTGFLAVLKACLCHMVGFTPLIGTLALWFTFSHGYYDQRKIFKSNGVYEAEEAAFGAASAQRPRERQLDVIGWALITAMWLVFTLLGGVLTDRGLIFGDLRYMWIYVVAAAILTVVFFVVSRRRRPA